MIVKGILDIKIENGIMKILCEFDNNTYQVIEFSIEFNGIEINNEKTTIGPNIVLSEKHNIIIPIKSTNNNCLFTLRIWK